MPRKNKAPEIRKREFVETAERLFGSRGYENTSVDDIVGKMGVAKGLFYYYFDSKEDLLETIIDERIGRTVAAFESVAARTDLKTLDKIQEMLESGAAVRARSQELTLFFRSESNRHLHADIEARAVRRLVPAMASIIRQGVSEGIFDTMYSEEAALAFFAISSALGGELYQRSEEASNRRRLDSVLCLFERVLGAAPGTFDFYNRTAFERPRPKGMRARRRKKGA